MQRIFLTACLVASFAAASLTVSHAACADVAKEAAEQRFTEGVRLYELHKYEEARVQFLQAATVIQAPNVMFNLARTEQLTGHDVEAIEHYRSFLKSSKMDSRISDKKRDEATGYITDLLTKVGQVEIEAPGEARISVNGKLLDEMPSEPIPVARGSKSVVEASYRGMVKSVTVSPKMGEVAKASFNFDEPVAAPVAVVAPPPSDEGKATRSTAGWVVPGVIGGVGVVGVGLGVGFALASHSAKTRENDLRAQGASTTTTAAACYDSSSQGCAQLKNARDTVDNRARVSTVSYIAGGALIVGAVAAWLAWPTDKERLKGVSVIPEVGPGTASFQFRGNF